MERPDSAHAMTSMPIPSYRGRFAPSPTGALHAGSLVAALASWLDARAHSGQWLVRIEDVDTPRTVPGATERILRQLQDCQLQSDEPVVLQSRRSALYQQALDQLIADGRAYPCRCSRKDIETALARLGQSRQRHGELVYPGTCRHGMATPGPSHGAAFAWRFRTEGDARNVPTATVEYAQHATKSIANEFLQWDDRWLGRQQQDVANEIGDFVLKRADGCFSYQLAVVVDDARQGITHVVRGSDLADNTARQILLQRALGLETPRYLHTPLVRGANGEKLSKQNGALALDTSSPTAALEALRQAARVLGLPDHNATSIAQALTRWTRDWQVAWATASAA